MRRWAVLALGTVWLVGCSAATDVLIPPRPGDARQPVLPGSLTLPAGSAHVPAVILLHGCSGLQRETSHQAVWKLLHEYAAWYNARGYAALVLDSFTPRGVAHVCEGGQPSGLVRALDAFQALDYLARQGRVDPARVVIQGLSHGGTTVLYALDEGVAEASRSAHRFAGGIAYYPACRNLEHRPFYAPLLILIGELDDWTPAAPCLGLHAVQEHRRPGAVRLTVYPGAYHSFDFPHPIRRNEWGKTLAFDPAATADATRRVDGFLREIIK
jgi:dienelactone hydrolase